MDSPREADAPLETWVIRSGRMYWRPRRCGYTSHLHEAGLYTEAEAKLMESYNRDPLDKAIHISQLEEEVRALRADIEAREAGLIRLVAAQLLGGLG